MADDWVEMSLGDLVDIKHGFAFKGEFFRNEPPGDVLLTPGNFAVGGGFKASSLKYYDGPVSDEFVLSDGDLLVTMTDLSRNVDTLGYPALVPPGEAGHRYLHNQRLGKVIVREDSKVDLRYLHYLLCSPEYRAEIVAGATGTTVKHTSPERIKRFRFRVPPLDEQRAIAHILGMLDDKIELNRRMNETQEAMARALFKSWFVDFDPVRAKAESRDPGLPKPLADLFPSRFVDSELGEIPEGWEVGTFGDIAEHPRRSVRPSEIDPRSSYIALEHMPKRCIALSDWGTGDGLESSKFEFKRGEVLFGKLRPYFHKVGVAPIDGVCSTDIVVMKPRARTWFGFVLEHASSVDFVDYTDAVSTGTKMPRTSWNEMARYELVLPPEPIAKSFDTRVRALLERILESIHESRVLAALRDALLPRLVSGELTVEKAKRLVGMRG